MSRYTVIDAVLDERARQDELVRKGKFLWTCANREQPNSRKLAVLAEEFGELAREVTEQIISVDKGESAHRPNMYKELIQIAAVAVAWAESLEP